MMKRQRNALLLIVAGDAVMAFAYAKWLVPNQIINGGVTSLAQIMHQLVPGISIPAANNLWLVGLLILALAFLGREVFLKSLFSSIVCSLCFTLFYDWPVQVTIQPVVDLLLASGLIAFGYFACLTAKASTVGVDVLALIMQRFRPQTNLSHAIRGFNIVVLAAGLLVFGWQAVVLGIVFAVIYTAELNWMLQHWGKEAA